MMKKLLSCIALCGFMQLVFAGDPVDVTATYLQNYSAPFLTTGETLIGTNTRWQILAAPWITENNLGTKGTDYTAWHVDANKSPNYPSVDASRAGVFTLTPGWDGFAGTFSNMKAYQVVTLPAGNYELTAQRAQDWTGASGAYLVVAAGQGIPDIANLNTALGSVVFSTAVSPNWTLTIPFKLNAETKVSIGVVASYSGAKQCVTLAEFKLLNYPGVNLNPLKSLISKYKAYTTTKYPVIGTYAEPAWNALQNAIATAEAYVLDEPNATDAGVTAQMDALNAAAATLETAAALPKLLATAKAMNNIQYPIGTTMGTYPQAKWDALQATIAIVTTFVANTTVTDQDIATNKALLQGAIDDLNASLILPFKESDATHTYWYQVRDMRNPNNYWEVGPYNWVSADGLTTVSYPVALIMNQVGDNASDYQLFKIMKAPSPSKGYYIYSKVSEDIPLSGCLFANKVILDGNGDSIPTAWQFGKTADAAHFTVFVEGRIEKQLNSYAGSTPPFIGFYYPGAGVQDPGNSWEFVEVIQAGQTDFNALKTLTAKAVAMSQSDYPADHFSVDKWNAFAAARDAAIQLLGKEGNTPPESQATVDAMIVTLQTAIDELNASYVPFEPSTPGNEKYYFIHDKRSPSCYMFIGNDTTNVIPARLLYKKVVPTADSTAFMFRFEQVAGEVGVYRIFCKTHPDTPISVAADGITTNNIHVDAALPDEENKWVLGTTPANDMKYRTLALQSTVSQINSFYGQTSGFIGFYDPGSTDDPGNDWTFVTAPVTSAVKKVSATQLGISVVNRRILANDPAAKLIVFNVLGQRVNTRTELSRGIYLVQVKGKPGTLKVYVK